MAINKTLKDRLARTESILNMRMEPLPTLFVEIEDASMPEPGEERSGEYLYTDADVIGVQGRDRQILRLPGEDLQKLKGRAIELMPECRVFYLRYVSDGAPYAQH